LGGGQVLTFLNSAAPKAQDILELVQTAEIEWNLNFGYLRFTKDLGSEGFEVIEVANWVEEILEIEVVQFTMLPGSDVAFVVRKKRI
jgi:phage head maturation protease